MEFFDVNQYKLFLKKCDIASVGEPVKGSLIYLPYGVILREKLYGIGIGHLKQLGFKQVMLSDYIDEESINAIDGISKISKNYLHIEDNNFCMTAGHEVSCYSLIREQLKDHSKRMEFPIKYFNFGSVFRFPKNTKFPFNYGERKSFLECYAIYKTTEEAEAALQEGIDWNRKIVKDILNLPGVEVERPRSTNKQFSKKSIHIDTITPLGETIITGMTYFHNDVFTKALNVKRKDQATNKNHYVYSTHFGLSENVLHSYIINCFDKDRFRFYSFLSPFQVQVVDATNNMFEDTSSLYKVLDENKYEYEVVRVKGEKINREVIRAKELGIPVIIILKNNNNNLEVVFESCDEQFNIDINLVNDYIKEYFVKNDKMVRDRLTNIEKNNIVSASTREELVEVVYEGKVAKIYCEKDEDNVKTIESYLQGGEVLGYQDGTTPGTDILSKKKTLNLMYVSRRS